MPDNFLMGVSHAASLAAPLSRRECGNRLRQIFDAAASRMKEARSRFHWYWNGKIVVVRLDTEMTSMHTATPLPVPLTSAAIESILSQHGYRLTGPRAAIVETMLQHERPFTAEQLVAELREHSVEAPSRPIGRATIYRTLEILAAVDVLTRLIQPDGRPAYIWDSLGHRHHLVCSTCGTAVAFTSCPVDELVRDLTRNTDFVIHDHMLEVFGICPRCQNRPGAAAS